MLKISISELSTRSVTLRLDGQISGKWVLLLQTICDVPLNQAMRVVIDLQHVSFADCNGIVLLRSLTNRGVELLKPLRFIEEQIKAEASR